MLRAAWSNARLLVRSLPCLQGRADSIRLAQKRLSVARGESWDERRAQPHSRLFSEGPRLQRLTSGMPFRSI